MLTEIVELVLADSGWEILGGIIGMDDTGGPVGENLVVESAINILVLSKDPGGLGLNLDRIGDPLQRVG